MNVTISVICYKYKALKNGEYPIMLRVCKDGKRNYQTLGISIDLDNWDFKKNEPKLGCPNREYLLKIISDKKAEYQTQVLEFKTSQKNFTASSLIKATEQTTIVKTVDDFYIELIAHYRKIGKIGNSNIYRDSYNSLKTFVDSDRLNFFFTEIDFTWLNEYERWMTDNGKAETTMSLLLRTLRSSYNKAIDQNLVRKEDYPFDAYKMSKFNTKTRKRAISKTEIRRILNLDLSTERALIQLSRDLFIFSYLQGGINLTDIAHLKYDNIECGRLSYIRQKTKGLINIPLQDKALEIMTKYMSPNVSNDDYIFPILNKRVHITAMQKHNRIHKIIGKVNQNLKVIGKRAKIETNLTTYVARHSYATVLKRSGVNTSIISESLGHSSEKVTQIYLDSFENSQIDEAMKNLL